LRDYSDLRARIQTLRPSGTATVSARAHTSRFLAMVTFLGLNGYEFDAPEAEVVAEIPGRAEGGVSEDRLADWIRRHSFRRR
jgi:prophage maintenance system killer protein